MRKIKPTKRNNLLKDRTYQLNKRETVILCLSFVLSLLSFVLTLFPQLNIISFNPVAKANAGDINAQYFLANHYYEIGDYDESIYWFKAASTGKGKTGAYAKNNLAYLYIMCVSACVSKHNGPPFVIARSEATWQSVLLLRACWGTDCHTSLRTGSQ